MAEPKRTSENQVMSQDSLGSAIQINGALNSRSSRKKIPTLLHENMGKGNKQGGSGGGFNKAHGRGGRGRGRGGGRGGRGGGGRGHSGFGGRRKLEITFDADARREYLTGMSARKKERRVFGLAMQKVKDRKEKLERKKEDRKSRLEQIEEAEKLKRMAKGQGSDDDDDESDSSASGIDREPDDDSSVSSTDRQSNRKKTETGTSKKSSHNNAEETMQTYSDANTTNQFGGSVIVTTTYGIPSDEESDDPDLQGIVSNKPHIDEEQKYAGNVTKYMKQVRSNLPSKKRKREQMGGGGGHRKGKHGAADMKGMGSGTDLKMAKKVLGRAAEKGGGIERGGKKGKKGRKGRR